MNDEQIREMIQTIQNSEREEPIAVIERMFPNGETASIIANRQGLLDIVVACLTAITEPQSANNNFIGEVTEVFPHSGMPQYTFDKDNLYLNFVSRVDNWDVHKNGLNQARSLGWKDFLAGCLFTSVCFVVVAGFCALVAVLIILMLDFVY